MAVTVVCLLMAWPRPAAAYIDFLPATLGSLCSQATHIDVLKVEKFSSANGVILFKSAQQLKAKGVLPLPEGSLTKLVIRPNVTGAKVILDWTAEGKTAVLFARGNGFKSHAHLYIDGYWYLVAWDINGKCWNAVNGEPTMLCRYCGTADKLGGALPRILRGEEVVVQAMVRDNRQDLEQRRARVQDLRVSLQILGNFKENVELNLKSDDKKPDPDNKKPNGKKPDLDNKKPADKKPDPGDKPDGKKPAPGNKDPGGKKNPGDNPQFVGTVKEIAANGKSFTLLLPPSPKKPEPTPIDIQVGDNARISADAGAARLAVGQTVNVWLQKGKENVARAIHIGKLPPPPEKKPPEGKGNKPPPDAPEKKPADKKPDPGEKKPDGKKPPPDAPEKKPDGKKPDPDQKPEGKKPADRKPDNKKEKSDEK